MFTIRACAPRESRSVSDIGQFEIANNPDNGPIRPDGAYYIG